MSTNIDNLQIQLQTAINNAAAEAIIDETTDTVYYLQLAKAIQALNMGQIRTVATVGSLPAAASNTGWLIFVEAEERLYFSDGTAWTTIVPPVVYDNTIYSWGVNTSGQLGDNTTVSKSSPVTVVGGFTDWCQLSNGKNQGAYHSLGVRQEGTAWGWGCNGQGRLGDNTTVNKSSPVSVVGGFTDWCQISAGGCLHSLAVRQNGTAWAWGNGGQGQLGDNTVVAKSSPVSVAGGFTDWCQVSAGTANFSLAVRQNGTAWGWGIGTFGRLGDNSTVTKSSPVQVVGGFCDWCQISAGEQHAVAIRQNGTVWSWGRNSYGQLGDNTIVNKSSPVSVVGSFCDWCQISAGGNHSLAVRQSGTAWAWGRNFYGGLGDNSGSNRSSPVSVIGGFTNWCQVSGGRLSSLGVRQNGTLWAWGWNCKGQLGDNTTVNKSSPVSVIGGLTDWCQVSAGNLFSLAIRSTAT
jgi:alpha-tubulin suppressor-like RCC1 family protein